MVLLSRDHSLLDGHAELPGNALQFLERGVANAKVGAQSARIRLKETMLGCLEILHHYVWKGYILIIECHCSDTYARRCFWNLLSAKV